MRNDPHLQRRPANHQPLTPLDFLERTVNAFPKTATGNIQKFLLRQMAREEAARR